METVRSKSAVPVLRCIELDQFVTVAQIAAACNITETAATKRVERLKANQIVKSALAISAGFSTLPVVLAIFASIDPRDFEQRTLDIEDVIGLADYIRRNGISSPRWRKIVREYPTVDSTVKIEAVFPLSGGGEWDLLILVKGADADFIRNAFVMKYLQHLPGVAKTNTASIQVVAVPTTTAIRPAPQRLKSRPQAAASFP